MDCSHRPEFHVTADFKKLYRFYKTKTNTYNDYKIFVPITDIIYAKTKQDALQKFDTRMQTEQFRDDTVGSDEWSYSINDSDNVEYNITNVYEVPKIGNIINYDVKNMRMNSATPLAFFNINTQNEILDYEHGQCVIKAFVKRYEPHMKKMNETYFNKLCREEAIKFGIIYTNSGVTPKILNAVCVRLNISHYAFDITGTNFYKYKSTHRNYPACVYYCSNNHMYQITDNKEILRLIHKTRKTNIVVDKGEIKDNIYDVFPIIENVAFDNIKEHENKIIIYNQPNLNEHFEHVIQTFNVVPKITKMDKHYIQQFEFNTKDNTQSANIIMAIDPNDTKRVTFKDVKKMCKKHHVPFKNQTLGKLIQNIRRNIQDYTRVSLNAKERLDFYNNNKKCNNCKEHLEYDKMEIDHIIALANGGNNELSNLQPLCKACHQDKTIDEKEKGYNVSIESTFNKQIKEIMDSNLAKSYAFISRGNNTNKKLHSFDINKCRKNILYHNTYEFPVFTVLDQVNQYNKQTGPGLYYVESNNNFPLRGNGWYSFPLIEYCLNNHIIRQRDIKQVIKSGNTAKPDYYKPIIDYFYNNEKEFSKLCINSMIGLFKPSKDREFWKSKILTTCEDEAFYHFLDKGNGFIQPLYIDDNKYYHLYEATKIKQHSTESPIYNMIIDMEAIEAHKLTNIVKSHGGKILDLNTDSVTATFNKSYPINISPIGRLNNNNIDGYYYPDGTHKYKIEIKERIRQGKMQDYIRTERYETKDLQYNINDLTPTEIIDKNEGMLILGRGGTGKTFFINQIQELLTKKDISFLSLAPTNKACRHISKYTQAQTLHKFKYVFDTTKKLEEEYIFIDEISMMPEMFYSFFIKVKNMYPETKFIISGDFEQLEPVETLNTIHDYENSGALYDLVDGNKQLLTICRRADDEYYNLTHPDNVNHITNNKITFNNKLYNFGNTYTDKHLAFTNKKRIEINDDMMNKTFNNMKQEILNKQIIKLKEAKRKTSHLSLDSIEIPHLNITRNKHNVNSQDMRIVKGMPVISCKNVKKMDIVNNEEYIIQLFSNTDIVLFEPISEHKLTLTIDDFRTNFLPAYCITVHKSQGCTFDFPYTIHEWSRFTSKMKYIALSRSSNFNNVNII